jgi:hypothetical protein
LSLPTLWLSKPANQTVSCESTMTPRMCGVSRAKYSFVSPVRGFTRTIIPIEYATPQPLPAESTFAS